MISCVFLQPEYHDIHVEPSSPSHHHHQQHSPLHQQQYGNQGNQSPRRGSQPAAPMSPAGAGANRPFSYGAPGVMPTAKHVPNSNQNGHNHCQQLPNQAQAQTIQHQLQQQQSPGMGRRAHQDMATHPAQAGSPAALYGKTESVFNPQPHHPPPHGPPPPPPGTTDYGQQYQVAAPKPR